MLDSQRLGAIIRNLARREGPPHRLANSRARGGRQTVPDGFSFSKKASAGEQSIETHTSVTQVWFPTMERVSR